MANRLALLPLFLLATTLPARAEYGYAAHNGVLGGLDGPKSYVLVDGNPDLMQVEYTVEAWVYPTSYDHQLSIVSKGAHEWVITKNGNPGLIISELLKTDFSTVVPLYQWTHLAVSYYSNDKPSVRFFTDGKMTYDGQHPTNGEANGPLTIGAREDDPESYFEGYLDEVRFWHHMRDEADIAENRFVGIGDAPHANLGSAITWAAEYADLAASYTFNLWDKAYDEIGGYDGTFQGSTGSQLWKYPPVPYNLALRLPGGKDDHVVVPDHPGTFNQTEGATIEMWVKPHTFERTWLFSRGHDYALGIDGSGGLTFTLGNEVINTGNVLELGRWKHVAATWKPYVPEPPEVAVDGSVLFRIYVNGKVVAQEVRICPYTPQGGDVRIGSWENAQRSFDGWLDEVRFWHGARTQSEIRRFILASGKDQPKEIPLGLWNFEGNVTCPIDWQLNGTFNNGKANACRFTAYINEMNTGAFGPQFEAHPTVLNRNTGWPAEGNAFPSEFFVSTPFVAIPPFGFATDQLQVSSGGEAKGFEAVLAVETSLAGDIACSLTHQPTGKVFKLVEKGSSMSRHVLSFFGDTLSDKPDDAVYPAPWGFLLGASGLDAADVDGTWICKCENVGNTAVLRGWGVRPL